MKELIAHTLKEKYSSLPAGLENRINYNNIQKYAFRYSICWT